LVLQQEMQDRGEKNRRPRKKTAALSSQTPDIKVKGYLEKLKDESMAIGARKFRVVTLPSVLGTCLDISDLAVS
jgi:hypothetical protein